MIKTILEKFKETIEEFHFLGKEEKVLVAFSGGLDSSGLLCLLLEIRRERNLELFLAHFNHKLRKDADEDERFVREVADRNSLPLFVGAADVRDYAKRKKINLEEAGRELRYKFLKDTAFQVGATKIATGHTMNDQAETFLMRLLRGSGLSGLASIFPLVEGIIIRPLLKIQREEIEFYLKKKGIPYRQDVSNFDRRFLRNKIRMDLIPYLKEHYDPRIVPRLSQVAALLYEEENLMREVVGEKAKEAILETGSGTFLRLQAVENYPEALKRRVVREFIMRIKGNLRGISFKDVTSILKMKKQKEFHLKKGFVLRREGDLIFIKKEEGPFKKKFMYLWNGRDRLRIKECNLEFEGTILKKKDLDELTFDDENLANFDYSKLNFPLLVRNRVEGDRYQPLGSLGRKKLKEIMRAKGIPLEERMRRPVFISGREIIWVLGLPVSEDFKVTKRTKEIFRIQKL